MARYDSLVVIADAVFEAAFETKPGLEQENYMLSIGRRTTFDDEGETQHRMKIRSSQRAGQPYRPVRPTQTSTERWEAAAIGEANVTDTDHEDEPELLIQFLLCILFASSEQLGYDPTVQRRRGLGSQKDEISYLYKVDGAFYATEGSPLSEDTTLRITS
ncbi:hypothetical protein C0995_007427 [Termitomyces sp. Mi166|nr:hypothetical protein C0995_007427 [Termitomyces sp. Mi166\